MDSNKELCYRTPYGRDICERCPSNPISQAIKHKDIKIIGDFSFQINPVKISESLSVSCEPNEQYLFTESLCSITITGKVSDIINIIENIEVS